MISHCCYIARGIWPWRWVRSILDSLVVIITCNWPQAVSLWWASQLCKVRSSSQASSRPNPHTGKQTKCVCSHLCVYIWPTTAYTVNNWKASSSAEGSKLLWLSRQRNAVNNQVISIFKQKTATLTLFFCIKYNLLQCMCRGAINMPV